MQEKSVSQQVALSFNTYWENNNMTLIPIVWDSFKVVIRGEYISAIKATCVNHNANLGVVGGRVEL